MTSMKVVIAGSRSITNYSVVEEYIEASGFDISSVICGCADGVDKLGWLWARDHSKPIIFAPAWPTQGVWALSEVSEADIVLPLPKTQGKGAGFARNATMAQMCDAAVIVHDGFSRGTINMLRLMEKSGKAYFPPKK